MVDRAKAANAKGDVLDFFKEEAAFRVKKERALKWAVKNIDVLHKAKKDLWLDRLVTEALQAMSKVKTKL
jgi:hypothetical protein